MSPYRKSPLSAAAGGPSPLLRTLVQFVGVSMLGAFLFVFHGISLHLTPWSQAIVNGIVKYAYPTRGQDDTTVVLFREDNLRDLKESYPVSYERHAEVLEALSVYEPAAVFVDFAFVDARSADEVKRLGQALCDLSSGGKVPVYLAAPPPPSTGINPGLLACAKPASAQMDVDRGVSGVLTYDRGAGQGANFMPTPAFALAAARKDPPITVKPQNAEPMEIIWGNHVSDLNKKWMNCTTAGPLLHLKHMLRETPLAAKRTCPHTRTISVLHLLGSSGDADVQEAVQGKAVFYGASFNMTGDRVNSPVFDELPGVYLHAMAYDNLVTFRDDYKRSDRENLSLSGVVNVLLLLFTVVLLLLVDRPPAFAKRLLGRLAQVSPRVKWLALGVAVLAVTLTVAVPSSLSAVLLLMPLLLGVVAVLHLATVTPRPRASARQFLRRGVLGVGVVAVVVLLFLVVDSRYGIEATLLLVVLPGYFVYKALVARDVLFVATTGILIGAAIVSFLPPINLGPRNIVAYVAFFEVARQLMQRAEGAATKYSRLRQEYPEAKDWGVAAWALGALSWLFKLCIRGDDEERRDATRASVAA